MIQNYLLAFCIVMLTASAVPGDVHVRLTCHKFDEVFLRGQYRIPDFSYSLCKTKIDKIRHRTTIYLQQRQLLKGKIREAHLVKTNSGSQIVIGYPYFDVQSSAKKCTTDEVTLEINIWKRTFKKQDISVTPWSDYEEKSVLLVATVVPGIEHESNIPYFDTPLGRVRMTALLYQKTVKHSHVSFALRHPKKEDITPVASIERSISIVRNYVKIVFHAASVKTDELSEYLYQKNSKLPSNLEPYQLEEAGLEVLVSAWCVSDRI